ncbi:MAG TPA: matrixin family metalloprotease [Vicinamibacteria bacterium]|jgi:hypothetical protein
MLRVRLVAAVATVLASTTSIAMPSRPRWSPVERIPVWIEKTPRRAHDSEMVRRAFQTWSAASGGALTFREVEEFPSNGIRVRFGARDGFFGEAIPYTDCESGRIVRADVLLSGDIGGDDLHRQAVTYLTALHEVGHALGLDHNTKFATAMYQFRHPADPDQYFLRYRSQTPSPDMVGIRVGDGLSTADLKALRRLYGP